MANHSDTRSPSAFLPSFNNPSENGNTDGSLSETVIVNEFTPHDVILGRGNAIIHLPGNRLFRKIALAYRELYQKSTRRDKELIAKKVIAEVEALHPPGRFLQHLGNNQFRKVSKKRALEKTAQALRERQTERSSKAEDAPEKAGGLKGEINVSSATVMENDVLYGGRGRRHFHRSSNRRFLEHLKGSLQEYQESSSKKSTAQRIVETWKSQTPPGRFLYQDTKTGTWHEMEKSKMVEKTCQALRDMKSKRENGSPHKKHLLSQMVESATTASAQKKGTFAGTTDICGENTFPSRIPPPVVKGNVLPLSFPFLRPKQPPSDIVLPDSGQASHDSVVHNSFRSAGASWTGQSSAYLLPQTVDPAGIFPPIHRMAPPLTPCTAPGRPGPSLTNQLANTPIGPTGDIGVPAIGDGAIAETGNSGVPWHVSEGNAFATQAQAVTAMDGASTQTSLVLQPTIAKVIPFPIAMTNQAAFHSFPQARPVNENPLLADKIPNDFHDCKPGDKEFDMLNAIMDQEFTPMGDDSASGQILVAGGIASLPNAKGYQTTPLEEEDLGSTTPVGGTPPAAWHNDISSSKASASDYGDDPARYDGAGTGAKGNKNNWDLEAAALLANMFR